ncbi:hypothetical protein FBZ85_10215 [Azospirillum brasilense]|nr:hypothetical protein [Azospirillum baldaniorum]TWA81641.1 hypothetical protein FBZ85_10215 [Azospirillum brasilense]
MKLVTAEPWWADITFGLSWVPDGQDSTIQVHLGPAAVEIPARWVPPDPAVKHHVGRWAGWHVYACLDASFWVLGWHLTADDCGLYVGPFNVQFETRPPLLH